MAVATAFVTIYAHGKQLVTKARAALQDLGGYTLTTVELAGEPVWQLDTPGRERWCMWVSERRLIKIGVQAGQPFPEDVVAPYLAVYPSDLTLDAAKR